MIAWEPTALGAACTMEAEEADLLERVARQVLALHRAVADAAADVTDPIVARLYPAAHAEAEDTAAFRRLAGRGIAERRIRAIERMLADLAEAGPGLRVEVDEASAESWLTALADLRIVLHVRAEQLHGDESARESALHVFDWLGFHQGTLLEALDADGRGGPSVVG